MPTEERIQEMARRNEETEFYTRLSDYVAEVLKLVRYESGFGGRLLHPRRNNVKPSEQITRTRHRDHMSL